MKRLSLHRFRQTFVGRVLKVIYPLLLLLAWVWRRLLFRTKFVAITGSVGKTTAKEALALILSSRFRVYRSARNQNGRQLVCLNVLRVKPWHQIAVIEAGTEGPGTLGPVSRLLRPDVVLVIDVAQTHVRGYKGLEETAREKISLIDGLKPGGAAIVNGDNPYLKAFRSPQGQRTLWFGSDDRHDLTVLETRSEWPERFQFDCRIEEQSWTVRTQLVGRHWVPAVAAAVLGSRELGIPVGQALEALALLRPFQARLEPVVLPSGVVFLRDEYNASVCTFKVAFETMREAACKRRVAVLADCTDGEARAHRRLTSLGSEAAKCVDLLILIEPHARHAFKGALRSGMEAHQIIVAEDLTEAARILKTTLEPGDLVLLKGQNQYHLSRLVYAQVGDVGCWKSKCGERFLCDICWQFGVSEASRADVRYLLPPTAHATSPVIREKRPKA